MSDDEGPGIRNQSAISYAGNLIDAAVSFGGLVLFANLLGAAGIGRFYTILAVVQVASFPAAGVGQAIQKRGSEYDESPAPFLGAGLTMGTGYVLLIVVVVSGLITVGLTGRFTTRQVVGAVGVLAARVAFLLINDAYKAQGKTGFATLADNVLGIVETVVQTAFVLLGFGVFGLLVGTSVATVCAVIGHLAVTSVRVDQPTRDTFALLLSFARWTTSTAGLNTVYDRLPVLALYAFASPTVVGYYSAANKLLVLGSYVGGSLAPALMVRASRRTTADAFDSVVEDLRMTFQYAGIVAIPMWIGALVMPKELMSVVFGFEQGAVALVGLGVFHIINTLDTVTYSFITGINRPDFSFSATVTGLLVRVIVIGATIQPFGLVGVIAAVVVSHATHLLLAVRVLRAELGRVSFPVGIAYQLIAAGTMGVAVRLVTSVVNVGTWLPLLLVVAFGTACYGFVLLSLDERLRQISTGILRDAGVSARELR
ncbi:MAG: polysaccharide biosynthesis C-terminal domain-containing protein [Halobaculum sp.]